MSDGADQSAGTRAAVIGLGSMGLGIALSLMRGGFEVSGCDVSPGSGRAVLVAAGGRGASTPAQAVVGAHIVVLRVVVNAAQTEAVLFAEHGAAAAMPEGAVFVSSATMGPDMARRLANRLEAMGRLYLDAPISGGALRAAEGTLTVLASGSPAAYAKARPALGAMAAKIYELGEEPGRGAAFKMINQLLAGVHIAAACEAITFAARQGLDLNKVYEVIAASAGNSWMFENRVPHVLAGDYTPRSAEIREGSGDHPGYGAHGEIPGAARRRRLADVPDGGRRRHGRRRRRLARQALCSCHRDVAAWSAGELISVSRKPHAPLRRKPHPDVQ